jgi:hypothetical protein
MVELMVFDEVICLHFSASLQVEVGFIFFLYFLSMVHMLLLLLLHVIDFFMHQAHFLLGVA